MRFSWLDVFTDRRFAGNPLAVVPDADALDAATMQHVARELNLSETVFVTGGARTLRIFTPQAEIPLAGHPIIGCSLELARLGRIPSEGSVAFKTGAGPIGVDLGGGVATMTQARPQRGESFDRQSVASMLGLGEDQIVDVPTICSTGIPQLFARVADTAVLRAVQPDLRAISTLAPLVGLSAWCADGGDLRQRFFAPHFGVDEDPATGSAAGALCALRVFDGAEPGAVTVRQGDEVGRPSTIEVEVIGTPGAPERVRVGGRAMLVAEGELALG